MTHRIIGLLVTLALPLLVAPLTAEAQQPTKVFRIGMLSGGSPPSGPSPTAEAFRQALRELGWVEGKNIVFESRFAEGNLDRLPALAADLVRLNVELIVASGASATRAAQHATSTIPIVMTGTGNPVRDGFVVSLAQPGGNITGVSNFATDLSPKRLEVLMEAIPGGARVAVLTDPANPYTPAMVSEMERAARALGVQLHILEVTDPSALEPAFAALTHERVDALMVLPAGRFTAHSRRIVGLVAHSQLPAIYPVRGFVEAGGLMSYGPSLAEAVQRAARYVDKILKGAKAGDLPVEQPMTFELVINLKTARALGLTIPPSLLLQATDVIR
jgi:putative tryptophan/tyrosine transport system substrate-binding protein